MTSSSWRLGTICVVAAVAFAIMITRAATAFERNPMLDVANLFLPAVAFCLAGLLVRNRPVVSTVMMVFVVAWSALLVCAYLSANCFESAVFWLFQWAAGLVAIIIATVFRLAGNPPISEAGGEAPGSRKRGRWDVPLPGSASSNRH